MSEETHSPSNLECVQLVKWALNNYPQDVEWNLLNLSIYDHARNNDKRSARISFDSSDEWVLNLRGEKSLLDIYFAIRVPREIAQEMSRLIRETERDKKGDGETGITDDSDSSIIGSNPVPPAT